MGADLYRVTTTDKARMEAVAAVDAACEANGGWVPEWSEVYNHPDWYFRDSYNDSSLFSKLDLSWWQDLDQYIGPNADGESPEDEYKLYPDGIRRLATEVRNRSELLMYNCRDLPDEGEEFINLFGEQDRKLDKRYFSDKYNRLLRFLDTAAEAGDTIDCSV